MAKALVTEREVRQAAREGKKNLDVAGAVVTPAARDLAGTLGLTLTGDARSGRSERPARGAPPKTQSTPPRPAPRHPPAAPPPPHRSPPCRPRPNPPSLLAPTTAASR